MKEPIPYTLEPIDEQNPAAGYRAVVHHRELIEIEALAEALVEEGLPTSVETVLNLFHAELAATASLLWEGWDVTIASGVLETPWPDAQQAALLGGTATGRPVASRDELAQRMIECGAPHTHSQIKAYMMAQRNVSVRLLGIGHRVEIPGVVMRVEIEGRFDGPDDELTRPRHVVNLVATESPAMIDWLEGYRELARRQIDGPPRPLLDGYENLSAERVGDKLCAGDEVCLGGYWLRFRPEDPRQGIFIVTEAGAAVRVGAAAFTGLSEAIFAVPDVPPGRYWLELRTVLVPRDGLQRATLPRSVRIIEGA